MNQRNHVPDLAMDEHSCGICSEEFTDIVTFLLHKLKHVDSGRNSSCPLCGLAFSRQISLREHLYRKHNIPGIRSESSHRRSNWRQQEEPAPRKLRQIAELSTGKPAAANVDRRETNGKKVEVRSVDYSSTENGDGKEVFLSNDSDSKQVTSGSDGPKDDESVELYQGSIHTDSITADGATTHIVIDRSNDNSVSINQFPQCNVLTLDACNIGKESVDNVIEKGRTDSVTCGLEQTLCLFRQCEASKSLLCAKGTSVLPDNIAAKTEPAVASAEFDIISESNIVVTDSTDIHPSANSDSTAMHTLKMESSKSVSPSSPHEEANSGFLFILCPKNVKGNGFSYSKLSFKCFHCDYKTTWRNCLVRHMQEKHADMLAIHKCISIHDPQTADQQQVMKMSEYTAKCAQQRRLTQNKRLRNVETQDLPGTFPCTKCGKTFGRLRYLRSHLHTHRTDRKHLCDECGKAFKAKSYLVAHHRTHALRTYSCAQCDFTSSINSLIHTHRQLHSEGSVLCDVCGAAYTDRATLKKHKLVHDPSRSYPCTYPGCTWRFLTEVKCRAHFRAHTTPGRFTCSVCGYVFRHKHHLQRHLVKIHSMDKAAVYRMTASSRHHRQRETDDQPPADSETKELVEVMQEQETVNLIMNSDISSEQLQTMLETGQLVITTDGSDSTINYEVADITMGVDCHTLIESRETGHGGQTIFIPHSGCSQIILQQEPETVPPVVET